MKVRDDEDLAITQLGSRPGPGRADDPNLPRSADPGPERAAIDAELPSTPAPSRAQLHALRAELEHLRAEHACLPLRELRELEHVEVETATSTASATTSLDGSRRYRRRSARCSTASRTRTPPRARLIAALDSAGRHLEALQSQRDRLTVPGGGLSEARDERAGLERRIAGLDATPSRPARRTRRARRRPAAGVGAGNLRRSVPPTRARPSSGTAAYA